MILELPFVYQATTRTATGNEMDRTYVERHEFVLQEIPAEDAPEVIRHVGFLTAGYRHQEMPSVGIRYHGGKFYEPLRWRNYVGDVGIEFLSPASFEKESLRFLQDVREVKESESVKLKGPPRPSSVIDTSRDRVLAVVQEVADQMIMVDGVIHRNIPEPHFVARKGIVAAVIKSEWEERPHLFRLNEQGAARRRAAVLGGIPETAVDVHGIELLDESSLSYSPGRQALRSGAYVVLRAVAQHLDRLPLEALLAFDDLRTAASEHRGEEKPDHLVVETLAALRRTLLHSRHPALWSLEEALNLAEDIVTVSRDRGLAAGSDLDEDLDVLAGQAPALA